MGSGVGRGGGFDFGSRQMLKILTAERCIELAEMAQRLGWEMVGLMLKILTAEAQRLK